MTLSLSDPTRRVDRAVAPTMRLIVVVNRGAMLPVVPVASGIGFVRF